jgi:hypothetical protein
MEKFTDNKNDRFCLLPYNRVQQINTSFSIHTLQASSGCVTLISHEHFRGEFRSRPLEVFAVCFDATQTHLRLRKSFVHEGGLCQWVSPR